MPDISPQVLANLLDYPIQAPPPGVEPNFVNPNSIAYQVYVTAGVCLPLILVFALMRILSRKHLRKQTIISHEIVFFTGLTLCISFITITIACAAGGAFGKHAWNVKLGAFTKSQLVFALLEEILLPLSICFVKISVLLLYSEIFHIVRWMRTTCMVAIVGITLWHLSMATTYAAMCAPKGSSGLDFLAAFISDKCQRTRVLVLIQGVLNLAIDIFIVALPLPEIWKLRMPLRRKLAVSAMFLIGLCAVASSVIGLYFRAQYYSVGSDNVRIVVPCWVTAMAEETAGVMVCCMTNTAAVLKSAKQPVLSWVSSTSDRVLRLTGSSRTGSQLSGHGSQTQMTVEGKEPASSQTSVSEKPSSRDRHAAWVDAPGENYSFNSLDPGYTGIAKKTEIRVLHAA